MNREQLANWLLLASVFFLPWQTQWIYRQLTLFGEPWQYGTLSLYAVEVLILITAALRGRFRPVMSFSSVLRPLMLVLGAAFLSVVFSHASTLALTHVIHVTIAVVLLLLVVDERTKLKPIMTAFVAGLIPAALLGWYQAVTGTSPASTLFGLAAHSAQTLGDSVVEFSTGKRFLRAYGPLSHPNVFGGFLGVGLLMLVYLVREKRTSINTLHLVATIAITTGLILTFSRGAWLATAAAIIFLLVLLLRRRVLPPRHALPFLALGIFVVTVTLFIFHDPLLTRFSPHARLEERSLTERRVEYQQYDAIALRNPITGVGAGNYTLVQAELLPNRPVWEYQPIHNSYLLFFAEVGAIGVVMFLYWLSRINRFRRTRPVGSQVFAAALVTVPVVSMLFDHYWWSSWSGLVLLAFTTAISLRILIDNRSRA